MKIRATNENLWWLISGLFIGVFITCIVLSEYLIFITILFLAVLSLTITHILFVISRKIKSNKE